MHLRIQRMYEEQSAQKVIQQLFGTKWTHTFSIIASINASNFKKISMIMY